MQSSPPFFGALSLLVVARDTWDVPIAVEGMLIESNL